MLAGILPEDPAMAAILAEAMAKEYGTVPGARRAGNVAGASRPGSKTDAGRARG